MCVCQLAICASVGVMNKQQAGYLPPVWQLVVVAIAVVASVIWG